jgi:hypothetical protein
MTIQFPSQERIAPPTIKPVDFTGVKDRFVPSTFATIAEGVLNFDKQQAANKQEAKKIELEERKVQVEEARVKAYEENLQEANRLKEISLATSSNLNEVKLEEAKSKMIEGFNASGEALLKIKEAKSVQELAKYNTELLIDRQNRVSNIITGISTAKDDPTFLKFVEEEVVGNYNQEAGSALEYMSTSNPSAYLQLKTKIGSIAQKFPNTTAGTKATSLLYALETHDQLAIQQQLAIRRMELQEKKQDGTGGTEDVFNPSGASSPTENTKRSLGGALNVTGAPKIDTTFSEKQE